MWEQWSCFRAGLPCAFPAKASSSLSGRERPQGHLEGFPDSEVLLASQISIMARLEWSVGHVLLLQMPRHHIQLKSRLLQARALIHDLFIRSYQYLGCGHSHAPGGVMKSFKAYKTRRMRPSLMQTQVPYGMFSIHTRDQR